MELCWYKTSWRSGSLWLDNMQQTLIEGHFFPLRGKEEKNQPTADFVSLICWPQRWGSETHHNTSLTLCPSYCTQAAFSDEISPAGARNPLHGEQQLSSSGTPPVPEAFSLRLLGWLLHAVFIQRKFHTNLSLFIILCCFFLFHFLLVSLVVHVFLFWGLQ